MKTVDNLAHEPPRKSGTGQLEAVEQPRQPRCSCRVESGDGHEHEGDHKHGAESQGGAQKLTGESNRRNEDEQHDEDGETVKNALQSNGSESAKHAHAGAIPNPVRPQDVSESCRQKSVNRVADVDGPETSVEAGRVSTEKHAPPGHFQQQIPGKEGDCRHQKQNVYVAKARADLTKIHATQQENDQYDAQNDTGHQQCEPLRYPRTHGASAKEFIRQPMPKPTYGQRANQV